MSYPSQWVFGLLLRRLRRQRQLSLQDVAAQLGISFQFLSQVERGLCSPSYAVLQRLARFYGLRLVVPGEAEALDLPRSRSGLRHEQTAPTLRARVTLGQNDISRTDAQRPAEH